MLRRMTIENIGVIDCLDIPFEDGLTALTGETGAGKSIIVNCLAIVLGAEANASVVRSGAELARIDAVFEADGLYERIPPALLNKLGVAESDSPFLLRVTREISAHGGSTCAVNGRDVPLESLRHAASYLAEWHGQRQNLAFLEPSEQRDMLDRYGGLDGDRDDVAETVRRLRKVRAEMSRLRRRAAKESARRDALESELADFHAIAPTPGEDRALESERARLAHAEQLGVFIGAARAILVDPPQSRASVVDSLAELSQSARKAAELDAQLSGVSETTDIALDQLQDLARSLDRYLEGLTADPSRLDAVEERIEALNRLKRQHGDSLEDVMAWAHRAQQDLAGLDKTSNRLTELTVEEERLNAAVLDSATSLSAKRSQAAVRLGRDLEAEIAALALEGARVIVDVRCGIAPTDDDSTRRADALTSCDESGGDHVEILIAPNVGEPAASLYAIASGGEISRVVLAIKTVLSRGDARTLALDEIDVGVGGHVGGAIGSKLAGLGRDQQVICVTHLPQVAAHAAHHIRVFKREEDGRMVTGIENLTTHDERADELSRMIGSGTAAARRSMGELLEAAHDHNGLSHVPARGSLRLLEAVG